MTRPKTDRTDALAGFTEDLRRFCLSRTDSAADAEDAMQETLSRYLRSDQVLEDTRRWLIRTASNVCQEMYRSRRKHRLADDLSEAPATDQGDPASLAVEAAWLREFLGQLRPEDRRLIRLLYLQGMSNAQAAKTLRVTEGNVRVMAMRARKRAKDLIVGMSEREIGSR